MAARNTVQFQKGLREAAFRAQYRTEDLCPEAVFAMGLAHGFVCPAGLFSSNKRLILQEFSYSFRKRLRLCIKGVPFCLTSRPSRYLPGLYFAAINPTDTYHL